MAIINNKYLNKKVKYKLPNGVKVAVYDSYAEKHLNRSLGFEPDVCINRWGCVGIKGYRETATQICIKADDKKLLDYLLKYNWGLVYDRSIGGAKCCSADYVRSVIDGYYRGIK